MARVFGFAVLALVLSACHQLRLPSADEVLPEPQREGVEVVEAETEQVSIDPAQKAAIIERIDELITEDDPGYAVGVVINGRVVFEHYAGLALLDTPTPIDAQTRFNIASVAKQYTALMVLDLVKADQIDLSEDFRTYLPDALPNVEQTITVAQLLTHTSGIRDVYDLYFLTNATWYETEFTNRTAMGLLNNQTGLNFEPGSSHLYSNSNYILLAELIGEVTGQPFHAYADDFLKARGMERSTVRRRYGVVVPRLARAYGDYGSGWLQDADIANTNGDGFMYATLQDQLFWEAQVWGNAATLSPDVITASQGSVEGIDHADYGYGLEFGFYRGLPITFHEGATGSYNAYTLRFPEQNVSIITMGNTRQVNAVSLARDVAEIVLQGQFTDQARYPTGPETLGSLGQIEDFTGLYELEDGTFVELVSRDGELYREIEWYEPVRLVYEKGNVFYYETDPTLKLALTTSDKGEMAFTLYSPNQKPQFAMEVSDIPTEEGYSQSVEGIFYNEETETEIILRHAEDDKFTMIKNDRPRTLKLVGRDYLVWNSYRISVLRDDSGRANGLSVDRGRIRNVAFERLD